MRSLISSSRSLIHFFNTDSNEFSSSITLNTSSNSLLLYNNCFYNRKSDETVTLPHAMFISNAVNFPWCCIMQNRLFPIPTSFLPRSSSLTSSLNVSCLTRLLRQLSSPPKSSWLVQMCQFCSRNVH